MIDRLEGSMSYLRRNIDVDWTITGSAVQVNGCWWWVEGPGEEADTYVCWRHGRTKVFHTDQFEDVI